MKEKRQRQRVIIGKIPPHIKVYVQAMSQNEDGKLQYGKKKSISIMTQDLEEVFATIVTALKQKYEGGI